MADLNRTKAPQVEASSAASQPNELVRQVEFQAALDLKRNLADAIPYTSIQNFESGIAQYLGTALGDTASIVWNEESGIQYAAVQRQANGGLQEFEGGLGVQFGTGVNDVARGSHTHDQLHDALTVEESGIGVQLLLDGQKLSAVVQVAGPGIEVNESGVRLKIGTNADQVAAGNHTHEGLDKLHDPLTVEESGVTIQLTLDGQKLGAEVRKIGAGWKATNSGLQLDIGTGSNQVAAGNHTHEGLHDAVTLAASDTIAGELTGQELTLEVRLLPEGGLSHEDSGLFVQLKTNGGLKRDLYGLYADVGTGANQVAAGNHTHEGLHDPLTVDESGLSVRLALDGQRLSATVRLVDEGGLLEDESGLRVDESKFALSDHSHDEFHNAVTVVNSNSVTLVLAGQQITANAKLNLTAAGAGQGLLGLTSAGLHVVLGESGNMAAPGNHSHSQATDVLGGFMSAADKGKLDELLVITPQDSNTVSLVLDDSGILRAEVSYGPGLAVGESGLQVELPVEDSETVALEWLNDRLKATVRYGAGLTVDESGLRVDPAFSLGVQLTDTAPPTLSVGQAPVVGTSEEAMRADAKPGLPGLATSSAHGFQDMEDKRRWDLSHIGGFNGAVTGVEIDCENELIYAIGEFTKYGNVGTIRIAAVKFDGTIDPLFAPGLGFTSTPGHLKRHSSGDLLVGGAAGKVAYRDGTAQWLHKLDRKGTPDAAFTSPAAIASTGSDQMLSLSPLSDGTIIAQSWETVRHLAATGTSLTAKTGGTNLHATVARGTDVYLMSRRAATFNGVTNPKAIKKLDYATGTGAVLAEWTSNGGIGGEANAAYAVLAPDGSHIIAANSLASSNGGGSSYAWNGGNASKHTGLYKILSNGAEDPDWSIELVVTSDWPRPLAIDSQGRVYFTGNITEINGTTVTPWRLYRVEADGSGLVEFAGFNGNVHDVKLVGDDYLVVAGAFTQYGTLPCGRMLFMDADGRAMRAIPTSHPTRFESRAITGEGTTELVMPCDKRFLAVEYAVGLPVYAGYTHDTVLKREHVRDGESVLLHWDMPASTEVTIRVYDGSTGGTLLLQFTGRAEAVPVAAEFRFDPETGGWRLLTLGYLTDSATDNTKVAKAGDTMTGYLTLHANPSSALHAATMQYVDTKLAKTGGTLTGLLDFTGATHGGVRLNNLTTAERDALSIKPVGCLIWNTTAGKLQSWNGSAWVDYALSGTELKLYKENGTGGELYATGSNAMGVGSYGQATGDGSFVIGSNLSTGANIASGVRSFAGGGQSLQAQGLDAVVLGGAGNIASSQYSGVFAGQSNTAGGSGNSVVLGGVSNNAGRGQSAIIGGNSGSTTAGGDNGVGLGGTKTEIDQRGEVGSAAVYEEGATKYLVAQNSRMSLAGKTTDDTPTLIGPYFAAREAIIVRRDKSVWKFELDVVAKSADGLVKTWDVAGALKRGTGAASLEFVGEPTITPQWADSGVESWDVGLGLNTTTGEFEVLATGEAGVTVWWGGKLDWLKLWEL